MKKIRGILNLVLLVLGGSLLYIQYLGQQDHRYFSTVAEQIQKEYHLQNEEVESFLNNHLSVIEKIVSKGFSSPSESLAFFPALQRIANKPYELFFIRDKELVLWSASTWIPEQEILINIEEGAEIFIKNKTGTWILKKRSLKGTSIPSTVVSAINLQRLYPVQGDYLTSEYEGIQIGLNPSNYPIGGNLLAKPLGFIQPTSEKLTPITPVWVTGLLLLLTLIGWIGMHNKIGNYAAQKFHPLWGGLWVVGQIFILSHPLLRVAFSELFSKVVVQTSAYLPFDSIIKLFDSMLGFWLMIFFHRNFGNIILAIKKRPQRLIFTAGAYFIIAAVFLAYTQLIKTLILETNTSFALNNLFRFELEAAATIATILFLLFGLYLFTHRMMLAVIQLGLASNQRLPLLGGVILLILPLYPFLNLGIGPLPLLLILLSYLSLFDLFADTSIRSLSWLSVWLIFFSAFPSFFLVKYNIEKSLQTGQQIAEQLAGKPLPELENELRQLTNLWTATPIQNQLVADSLRLIFPILSNNFQFLLDEQTTPTLQPFLQKNDQQTHPFSYQIGTNLLLIPNINVPKSVYQTLLQNSQLDVWKDMRNYDFAMAMGNSNIYIQGQPPQQLLIEAGELSANSFQRVINSQRADLLYRTADGTTIVIGQTLKGYQQGFAIFSFFFILLTLILLVFSAINSWVEAIPFNPDRPIFSKPTLSNRVQLAFGGLILISFLVFGWYTVSFFNRAFQQDESKKLNDLVSTVKKEWENIPLSDQGMPISHIKNFLVNTQSKYQMDLTWWNPNGILAYASNNILFTEGIKVPQIPSAAYYYLNNLGKDPIIIPSKTGTLSYQEAYLPITKNQTNLGYLGIPYFSGKTGLSEDIYDFFGTLLSFYVLFLLLAVGVVILLSQTITLPITRIANRLQTIKLDEKNEPLQWSKKDEIGVLVDRYNEMIFELDEKTKELKQSEREGAWRQMAKQVAHEIKNPLTPMKLSIQHLQRAFQAHPQDIENHIKKVSQTIVEQIEGLAKIATEFSNFASMPKAVNQVFDLNTCVQSIYELHVNGTQSTISFQLILPPTVVYVNADKAQLIRVLQNLVTNAIQAIPVSGQGKIIIDLSIKKSEAYIQITDNGTGIPLDIQEMVFVPNFTTKSSGSGLGLAICKSIITAAGGKISFTTKEDVGTTFTVQLPIYEQERAKN
ncbi:MAG: hypothetical protein RLZZ248_552 [Bacteroidota bacterium]